MSDKNLRHRPLPGQPPLNVGNYGHSDSESVNDKQDICRNDASCTCSINTQCEMAEKDTTMSNDTVETISQIELDIQESYSDTPSAQLAVPPSVASVVLPPPRLASPKTDPIQNIPPITYQQQPVFTAAQAPLYQLDQPPPLPPLPRFDTTIDPPPIRTNVQAERNTLKRHSSDICVAQPKIARKLNEELADAPCDQCVQQDLRVQSYKDEMDELLSEDEYQTLMYRKKLEEYQNRKELLQSLVSEDLFRLIEDYVENETNIMESAGDWCLIESDPGVFTQLIKTFGVKGVQVEEMWSMDEGEGIFDNLRPVHGLIFLFKYLQHEEPPLPVVTDNRLEKIYFAKQIINNACATHAVVSLLLNCNHPDIDLGPELTKLKEFSMSDDPNMRGRALSNSQTIRSAHNSMSNQTLIEFDQKMPTKDDDAYHFVGYIPINGRIYELDGLRDGPIDHGAIAPEQDWLDVVHPIIMKRINVYTEGEIHFNLMALVSDRKMIYERQIGKLMQETQMIRMANDETEKEICRLKMRIEYEDAKMLRYRQEMARRRHNYLPFIITLLKILAEEKKLMPLYEKAKECALKKGQKKLKV